MSSSPNNGHRKSRSFYTNTLEAAKNGSRNDVETFITDLDTVPQDLLPEVLNMFLSHLKIRKFAGYKQVPAVGTLYSLAFRSLKGLHCFVELENFLSLPFIANSLLVSWKDILDCTMIFHADALEKGNREIASFLNKYFVRIFHGLTIVESERIIVVFSDPEFQGFVSKLFFQEFEDEEETSSGCSGLLLFCLRWPTGIKRLLKATDAPNPSEIVAKKPFIN